MAANVRKSRTLHQNHRKTSDKGLPRSYPDPDRVWPRNGHDDFDAEAIGYSVVHYRVVATCLSAAIAALAGALYAIWLRYVGPDTSLSMEIMIHILLMAVIGGMGTMYGAVIGATLFILAQNYLQALMGSAANAVEGLPLLPDLLNPERWLLWPGVLFILSVYFFPTGIVGRLRARK